MIKYAGRLTGVLCLVLAFLLSACAPQANTPADTSTAAVASSTTGTVAEDGLYSDAPSVAAYLRAYHKLPANYMTKQAARAQGWQAEAGNLRDLAPMATIGGDRFYNREGILPKDSYWECDVNYEGGPRNAERLVYNREGRIYYTKDHYRHFTDVSEEGPA